MYECNIFLKVHLVAVSEFKHVWSEIFKAAGCLIIEALGDNQPSCDLIVVGNDQMKRSTKRKAQLQNIPTVTIQWVKQCIVTGTKVDFNAHEIFIYRE